MARKWISVLLIAAILTCQTGPAMAQTEGQPPSAEGSTTPAPAAPDSTQAPALAAPDSTQAPNAAAPESTRAAILAAPESTATDIDECTARGKADGKNVGTGGSFLGGFVGGVVLGLIGTGIAYVVQTQPDPPATVKYARGDPLCRMAYNDAYGKQGQKKKRGSALGGGLIGTFVFLVIYAASSSD